VNTSYLLAGFGLLHASASTHLDMPFGFFLLRVVFPAAFCIFESIFGVWDLILVYDIWVAVQYRAFRMVFAFAFA
jgi:hypothetical protein